MSESQRNLLILVAIAIVGVMFSGAYGVGSGIAKLLINIAFTVMLVWLLVSSYQRHSGTIAQMAIGPRLLLQVSGIVLIVTYVTGTLAFPGVLPSPPFGWAGMFPVMFWSLVLLCAFGIWYAWQQRVSRW